MDSLRRQQIWEGVLGRSVHGEHATLGLIELDPDARVPEHSHANEQLGIVVEGSLHFRIGEETREVAPGDMWCIPAHVPHAVEAVGSTGAILVEAFAPPREDWHSLESHEPARGRWP
jgi:quercetin dioxygenase-like cupin family protein